MAQFDQPEKVQARRLALTHAVESLTAKRESSPVVTLDHFELGMKYVCDSLEKTNSVHYTCFPCPHQQVKRKSEAFVELHTTRVGSKKASELQVLFLSGPEPMNDLKLMLDLGIRTENVWAVDADKETFEQAVQSVSRSGYGIKMYRGGLKQFFEIVPQQFDIVYFDAFGSLPSSKRSTLDVLRQLFERQRLAPLGVLITNFSQANQDGKNLDLWAKRLGSWFFGRDDWEDFENDYFEHVAGRLDDYYSNFITKFVIEFAGLLMPWWRVGALDGARQEYYSPAFAHAQRIDLAPMHAERLTAETSPESMYFQDSFPAYGRVFQMATVNLPKDDPLRRLLFDERLNQVRLSDAVGLAYALKNCGDPGFSATADLNKRACSEAAIKALNTFRWIDQDLGIFCDSPGPHLLV